jgi:hypothetical protein
MNKVANVQILGQALTVMCHLLSVNCYPKPPRANGQLPTVNGSIPELGKIPSVWQGNWIML